MESAAVVREQLERLLAHPSFAGANRRSRLLRYLVERALEDDPSAFKESVVAMQVFDRTSDHDPQLDASVRVEIGRLRVRLAEYYANHPDDPIGIEIPKGSYRPVFAHRAEELPDAPAQLPPSATWKIAGMTALACAVLFALFASWRWRLPASKPPASIAVLPFLNLGGDPSDEYLGDGITEDLTQTLAGYNDLRVVSRTSAFQYKGKNVDVREIGRSLSASAVLEGSATRRGNGFHIVAQLIRSSDGYHLWAHTYESTLADLPVVELQIAQATRATLSPSVAAPVEESPASLSPEAHDLYMRAVFELNQRSLKSTTQAIELARQAAEKDPKFALPFVVMAAGESQSTQFGADPREAAARAWTDIERALSLDPSNSAAHAQKGLQLYTDRWDWPGAEHEFQRALTKGSHGQAENLYGWALATRGRFEESRRRLQNAAELDPLSLGPQLNQIQEWMAERNYAAAKKMVDQVLRAAPTNGLVLSVAASVAQWQHDCPAAESALSAFSQRYPESPSKPLLAFVADSVCGHPEEARKTVEELFRDPAGDLSPYTLAAVAALAGDSERAIRFLEKSAELHEPRVLSLRYEAAFDVIRQDPRLIALQKRLGLPD